MRVELAPVLDARLRRLDAHRTAALVADLWAARGFETERDGDTVVATRADRSVAIRALAAGGRTPLARRTVDGVVAVADGSATVGAAPDADPDARVLDAADLREMLLYAVDRETASDLCRRHLGGRIEDLRSSPLAGIRNGVRALGGWPATALVVVGLLVVAGVGVSGLSFGPERPGASGVGPDTAETSGAGPTVTATPATAGDADTGADVAAVPGLSADGVANLTALAAAHERVLAGQSYTVWVDLYRPLDGSPNESQIQRDVDVAVAGDRYLVEATVESGYARQEVLTVYADGSDRYVAERTRGDTTYRRLASEESAPMAVPGPAALRRAVVVEYLSTPETTVTGPIDVDGRPRYRITGRGQPAASTLDQARNYTVVALVDRRGFVERLTARYTVATAIGSYGVRFEMAYDRLGETTVVPPAWYERRFVANATTAT